MTQERRLLLRFRRLGVSLAITLTIVGVSLAALAFSSSARLVMHGRDGCGDFLTALNAAPPGRILAMMDQAARDSNNAVVTKSVTIQGGWTHMGGGGCDEENQHFPGGPGEANASHFVWNPDTRSYLQNLAEPVLRIQHTGVLTIESMGFIQNGEAESGGGIWGNLTNGATLLMLNVEFNEGRALAHGGGLYLEVRGGAHVIIDRGLFTDNESFQDGGAFEIHVYDGSHVTITNSRFEYNRADGPGGAGRILIDSGYVTLTDNIFLGNESLSGEGNDLSIEATGGGAALVWLNNNVFDTHLWPDATQVQLGDGVRKSGNNFYNAYLPLRLKNATSPLPHSEPWPTATPTATPTPHALITDITTVGNVYHVLYEAVGFEPQLPGVHLHFFFDWVPPEHAGMPGEGPWKLNPAANGQPASNPFTGYTVDERPAGSQQMCVYVANPDHSVRLGTGNCFPLPF